MRGNRLDWRKVVEILVERVIQGEYNVIGRVGYVYREGYKRNHRTRGYSWRIGGW